MKYFSIFNLKMPKHFSTRGQTAKEEKLAAQEVWTGVFFTKTATVLQKLQTIFAEWKAVEGNFSRNFLPQETLLAPHGQTRHRRKPIGLVI